MTTDIDNPEVPKKKCNNCFEVKPLPCFYKHVKSKDGYQYACKTCMNQQNKENRARKRKFSKSNLTLRERMELENNPPKKKTYFC